MSQINKKIAQSLDMEIPEDQEFEADPTNALTTVEPHELTTVENPDLPDMMDIDRSLSEGEKQLEMVIRHGLGQMERLQDSWSDIDPKYRNRFIENVTSATNSTLDAIKFKNELQLKKKELRLKEDLHRKPDSAGGESGSTNNFFIGSREDLLRMFDEGQIEDDTEVIEGKIEDESD